MRAVIQRVSRASVTVDGEQISAVGAGLLVLLGVSKHDSQSDCDYVIQKILGLRIFNDAEGKMNLRVQETGGSILVVSQFTLYGDVRKGRRPGFDLAATGADAQHWYSQVIAGLRLSGLPIATGKFGAHMKVKLENDGPVTLLLDSSKAF